MMMLEGGDRCIQAARQAHSHTVSLLCCSTAIGDVYNRGSNHSGIFACRIGGEKHVLLSDLATMVHN
jgi:hypothetical protein